MQRILIIGPTGSGKTTLGLLLSSRLDLPLVELDALHWGPEWTPVPEFQIHAEDVIQTDRWIVEGGYVSIIERAWPKADLVIWLDYSLTLVMNQLVMRSLKRAWDRNELYNGNRESFYRNFLSKDSILIWLLQTYKKRSEYFLKKSLLYNEIPLLRFSNPKNLNRWMESQEISL